MEGSELQRSRRSYLLSAGWLVLVAACGAEPPPPPLRTGPTQVLWFTSADGHNWQQQAEPLAEHFVSLGLSVRPDGLLWVTGIDQGGAERGWWSRHFGDPEAAGLVFDGQRWSRTSWPVADPDSPALLDPQWLGDALWYVSRGGQAGDPAEGGGSVQIRSAPPPRVHLEGPGITDPSPVYFQGALRLFVSALGKGVVQLEGEPLVEVQRFPQVQVPQAVVIGDELWLVAQGRIRARRQPVLARSKDGRSFTPFVPLLPWDAIEHCTSPVLGPHPGGGLVLLCVAERPPDEAP